MCQSNLCNRWTLLILSVAFLSLPCCIHAAEEGHEEEQHTKHVSSTVWGLSMGGSAVSSSVSLIGIFLMSVRYDNVRVALRYLCDFGVGAFLSVIFVHLLPELAAEGMTWKIGTSILGGYFLVFVSEKLLHSFYHEHSHSHGIHDHAKECISVTVTEPVSKTPSPTSSTELADETASVDKSASVDKPTPLAIQKSSSKESTVSAASDVKAKKQIAPYVRGILLSSTIHNFFDGVIVATAFLACDASLGWTVVASTVVHEIPKEFSDFLLSIRGGLTRNQSLLLNFLSGLVNMLGAIVLLSVGEIGSEVTGPIMGFGAGVLLFIATTDIAPQIIAEKGGYRGLLDFLCIAVGAVAIGLTLLFDTDCAHHH